MIDKKIIKLEESKSRGNLAPKFCPIDGSPLEAILDILVCDKEGHNWELELGKDTYEEFYTLTLTGY